MAKAKTSKIPNDARRLLPSLWNLSRTIPHRTNARTHPPAQIDLLAELMKRWGPDQAIVVDENCVILKGHGRREAAYKAGLDKAYPVVQRHGLPEHEKEAMRISDNQVGLRRPAEGPPHVPAEHDGRAAEKPPVHQQPDGSAPREVDREGVAFPGLPRESVDQVDPLEAGQELLDVEAAQVRQPGAAAAAQGLRRVR